MDGFSDLERPDPRRGSPAEGRPYEIWGVACKMLSSVGSKFKTINVS